MSHPLPNLINKDAFVIDMGGFVNFAKDISVVAACLSSNKFMLAILNQMLSAIEPLTGITHYGMLKLRNPANLAAFQSQLFPLITFDIIPDKVMQLIFNSSHIEDEPLHLEFEKLGYEGKLVITNIGSFILT